MNAEALRKLADAFHAAEDRRLEQVFNLLLKEAKHKAENGAYGFCPTCIPLDLSETSKKTLKDRLSALGMTLTISDTSIWPTLSWREDVA